LCRAACADPGSGRACSANEAAVRVAIFGDLVSIAP
jgi:hypothetical protein